jgi:hypothetical protein
MAAAATFRGGYAHMTMVVFERALADPLLSHPDHVVHSALCYA